MHEGRFKHNLPLIFWISIFIDDLTVNTSLKYISATPVINATGFHAHVTPYWNDAVHLT